MRTRSALALTTAALLVGALPYVAAHGGEEMDMGHGPMVEDEDPDHQMPSYFRHPEHQAWNSAHTILMILAWVIAMPLAVFLSAARSRYHLPTQVLFHIINGLGICSGFVYNHATPDLYVNNAHHPLGWIVTAFTIAWTLMSTYVAYSEHRNSSGASLERTKPVDAQSVARYDRLHQYDAFSPRDSRDSGQGTERNSASLCNSRQNSTEPIYRKPDESDDSGFEDEELHRDPEKESFLNNHRVDGFLSRSIGKVSSRRVYSIVRGSQIVLEKFLLLLGFTALVSGFVVSGGIYRDRKIFSGLAHYIKGAIFIWYGLLTLGRWMGAFTEFGWAWNVRPQTPLVARWKTRIPSAEFTESFVIWLYGATNVFMEHMNNRGKGWSPSDLEHLSITVLFFGGGLLGMIIESPWIRSLMDTTVADQKSKNNDVAGGTQFGKLSAAEEEAENQQWEEPETYRVPLNPMPAMTIMLLGMMMGSHHQSSMVSTMMHAQWGGLFSAFAIARAVTYVTLYVKPPASHYPSRPPSEIVAAFCLTSGGFMFMNSSADVVWAIESNGLDAMTIFTTSLGITGVTLAWEVVLFAIKGWAVRLERLAAWRQASSIE